MRNNQNRQTWNLNEEKEPRRDWQRNNDKRSDHEMKEGKGREEEKKKKQKKKKKRKKK